MILQIPSAQYHADLCVPGMGPTLSSHLAREVLVGNMRHVWLKHPRLNPKHISENEEKFRAGRALHSMVLEEGADIVLVDPEEYRTEPTKAEPNGKAATGWNNKAIKARRDEVESDGRIPMLPDEYSELEHKACAVHEAVAREPDLCGMRLMPEFGKAEQTIITEVDGVLVRIRPDFLSHDFCWMPDLKSAATLSPDHFIKRQMVQMGYDFQLEFYGRAIEQETGVRPDCMLIVMQDFYPYSTFFVRPSQAMQAIAKVKVDRALQMWREALKADAWPEWPSGIISAEPSAWAMAEAEEMAVEIEMVGGGVNWDRNAPGSRENFLGGRVRDGQ